MRNGRMELEGKKVLVLGAGKSGINSATLLARKGAVVALHDKKPVAEWSEAARSLKENFGVGLIEGMLPSWLLDQIELPYHLASCAVVIGTISLTRSNFGDLSKKRAHRLPGGHRIFRKAVSKIRHRVTQTVGELTCRRDRGWKIPKQRGHH